jgi:hypothetical protein
MTIVAKEIGEVESRPFTFIEMGGKRNMHFFFAMRTKIFLLVHVIPRNYKNTIVNFILTATNYKVDHSGIYSNITKICCEK